MKHLFSTLVCVLCAFVSTAPAAKPHGRQTGQSPNIVMLFIDDWAWNGSPVPMDDSMANSKMPVAQMPNLEKLAQQGMKFRNAYSGAPQCSPSRVCLQTGKSAARSGFTVYLGKMKDDYYDTRRQYEKLPMVPNISDGTIDADAVTIPEALKPLGYVSAHIGKWHMGGDPGAEGYVLHDGNTNNDPGNTVGKVGRQPENITDPKLMFSVTEKAIGFMQQQATAKQPFYLQISHYAMHAGSECLNTTRQKYVKHPLVQAYYQKTGKTAATVNRKQDPAIWLGMAEDLDGRIGAVLEEIKRLGIEDNTYVIVVADNGYRHKFYPGLTQPLHAAKWWAWQGGIRVPMIVRGPGIEAGSVFKENVVNYDFLPTFVDWAGGDSKSLQDIDGVSLAGYLRGVKPDDAFKNRHLYFHYPHYRTAMPHSAIVSGTRKVMHFYEQPDVPMLFDLSNDEGEVENIATKNYLEHKELFGEMMRYFKQVGARLPKVNPDFDPEHYKAAKEYESRIIWGPFKDRRELEDDEKPPSSTTPSTDSTSSTAAQPHNGQAERLPNVVFMFADDLGWGDLGCYGHPYARTPAIDKLASEGTRFTQFYVTGVTCCPSRTGFMTGRHTARFPKYPADFGFGDRVTITALLKKRGYRTGHFGKWHMGPEARSGMYGIDEYGAGANTKDSPRGRDAGLFDAAIRFIKKNADQPFYVNVWGHATHYPVSVHSDLAAEFNDVSVNRKDFAPSMQHKFDESAKIDDNLDQAMRQYLGDVWAIDLNVKRLLAALDELGLRENTIVVFSSDHGPAPVLLGAKKESKEFSENMLGYAGEFRGGKHEQYEGGVRAPFIIRWPGHIKADHTDSTSVVSGMDWMPTLCRLAGITELPTDLDGEDVSDIWLGKNRERNSPLFWKVSSPGASVSLRDGHWKLHLNPRRGEGTSLYDLSRDPSESNNVAANRPNILKRLTAKARIWNAELPKAYEKNEKPKDKKKRKRKE
jgi:arylsulfatase A